MSDHEDDQQQQSNELGAKLALRIHATHLPRQGLLKTLPSTFAIVSSVAGRISPVHDDDRSTIGNDHVMRPIELGQTEVIDKNCNPQWTRTIPLSYEYGSECYFFVQICRLLGGDKGFETVGNVVCEIGDILGSKSQTKAKRLPKGGVVFCRLEPVHAANHSCMLRFQFAAKDLVLRRKSLTAFSPFSNGPDTILQISKHQTSTMPYVWSTVYRSTPVENSLNPTWDVGEMSLDSVCSGDYDRPLRLTVLVRHRKAQPEVIGICETTLRVILNTQRDTNSTTEEEEISSLGFQLQRSVNKAKPVGRLHVTLAQVLNLEEQELEYDAQTLGADLSVDELQDSENPYIIDISALPTPIAAPATFQDYIRSGWVLDFSVAIDFTSSNGDPRIPGTLHDQNPISLNDYEETIVSIGNAMAPYTQSRGSAVWGFGCKFGGVTRHIFQCGLEPEVFGVNGILKAYRSVFESDVTMSGPTLFDQVIQAAAVRARQYRQSQQLRYCILLVITDGISHDVEETRRKLLVYSQVPLSIIFVGVGRTDFCAMYDLCSQQAFRPAPGARANATFVEYRHHQHDPTSLGRSALQGIPAQLVEYMLLNNIQP